jgi:sirohydrochlorin ferrochelatase
MQDMSAHDSVRAPARLVLVAHGTASAAGSATTRRLAGAIAAARPKVPVELAFLDVVGPRLGDVLTDEPSVVVPLLLSTGYHVQTDIPAIVAPHARTRVTAHLGPHPLVVRALAERLAAARTGPPETTVLVGAGSSRPEAHAELGEAAALLGAQLGRAVPVLTMGDDLRAALRSLPGPVEVATYLLAEGQFVSTLFAAADGIATVAAPLGVHPALVKLVWARYDGA